MLKKNNFFFKKLEKFKKNKALILENSKYITYNELLLNSKIISKQLKKKKKINIFIRTKQFRNYNWLYFLC